MTETKVSDVVFGAILLAGGVILFWFLSQFASLLFSASPPRGCLEVCKPNAVQECNGARVHQQHIQERIKHSQATLASIDKFLEEHPVEVKD